MDKKIAFEVFKNTMDFYFNKVKDNIPKELYDVNYLKYLNDVKRGSDYISKTFSNKDLISLEDIKWMHKNMYPEWFKNNVKSINSNEEFEFIPWELRKFEITQAWRWIRQYMNKTDVEKEINDLINRFNLSQKTQESILFFWMDLAKIHPFGDWNWRISMLIVDIYFALNWFKPLYLSRLKEIDKEGFYKAAILSRNTRNLEYLFELIKKHKL